MVERSKLLGCSCRQAGWLAGMMGGGGTRRLREVAPPPLASSRGKPAVCLLCCAESACSSTTVVLGSALRLCSSLPLLSLLFPLVLFHFYTHILPLLLVSINSPLSSLPLSAPTGSPSPSLLGPPPLPVHTLLTHSPTTLLLG